MVWSWLLSIAHLHATSSACTMRCYALNLHASGLVIRRRVLLRQWWEAQDSLLRHSRISGASAGRINLLASLSNSPGKLASAAAAKVNGRSGRRPGSSTPAGDPAGGTIKASRVWTATRG